MMVEPAPLAERLIAAESPYDVHDWQTRDGYYVTNCRVSSDDVPGLVDLVRQWADGSWPGDNQPNDAPEPFELLPVTAWRTLADLKDEAAIEPLVAALCELEDDFDDWVSEELPFVFGKLGPAAIEPLHRIAINRELPEFVRTIAARGLRQVVEFYPHTRERVVPRLTEMMVNATEGDLDFNSLLLVDLVELRAVEAAEPIERAFAANLIDVGMMGSWEEVSQELEVEGLGLEMPEHQHSSIDRLRRQMGIGIFSDKAIFGYDEVDYDAEQAYYERVDEAFSRSSEARQVIERHGALHWHQGLLEFGVNYLGETVEQMTRGSVEEYVLKHVPRKVSVEASAAAEIISELALFWQFLDRVYKLPAAKEVAQWLTTDGLVARLETALSDSLNFGMAKSIVMQGHEAGYDMTSEAGIASFMTVFNEKLAGKHTPASRVTPTSRVGRNDPCPCGSGRKYKKCCGGGAQRG